MTKIEVCNAHNLLCSGLMEQLLDVKVSCAFVMDSFQVFVFGNFGIRLFNLICRGEGVTVGLN